jgi:cytochrome c-type biogenesis protein CcmE
MGIAVVTNLVLKNFKDNLTFFLTPTQLKEGQDAHEKNIRIGGLVKTNSLVRSESDLKVTFIITDNQNDVSVTYRGILPDLFKEGKGAVVGGRLDKDGHFEATEVLAKHDENYMPPEVAKALKQKSSDLKPTSTMGPNP